MSSQKHIVLYSGPYSIEGNGATKTVDINLVKYLRNQKIKVTWIANGHKKLSTNHVDNIPCLLSTKDNSIFMIKKIIFYILRKLNISSKKQSIFDESVAYDLAAARIIQEVSLKQNIDYVIVRNGFSLNTIKQSKRLKVKVFMHAQWLYPDDQEELNNNLNITFYKDFRLVKRQKEEYPLVDYIWCISSMVYDSFNKYIPKDKLLRCGLGVDASTLNYNFRKKYNSDKLTIAFVGNINYEKGIDILFNALLDIDYKKDIKLILHGAISPDFQNTYSNYIRRLERLNLDIENRVGVPTETYNETDIFILPSRHDSFGLVVPEALSAGCPVIVSDNVGAKDLIINKENGFIFKSGDFKQLEKLILGFLEEKINLGIMSENARLCGLKCDWNLILRELDDWFR